MNATGERQERCIVHQLRRNLARERPRAEHAGPGTAGVLVHRRGDRAVDQGAPRRRKDSVMTARKAAMPPQPRDEGSRRRRPSGPGGAARGTTASPSQPPAARCGRNRYSKTRARPVFPKGAAAPAPGTGLRAPLPRSPSPTRRRGTRNHAPGGAGSALALAHPSTPLPLARGLRMLRKEGGKDDLDAESGNVPPMMARW